LIFHGEKTGAKQKAKLPRMLADIAPEGQCYPMTLSKVIAKIGYDVFKDRVTRGTE
jgi:hypothetical protein